LWFVGIPLMSGRLIGTTKKGLTKIIKTYQLDIRVTPNQDILLCNIGSSQLSSVKKELSSLGIINPGKPSKLSRHAIACPALPLCGLALTEAERILPKILNNLEALLTKLEIKKSILFRMTGCPNGCARPYMAELALVGSGSSQYQLWLGGTPDLKKLGKPYIQRLDLDKLEITITPLLLQWKSKGKGLSFGGYINKISDQEVSNLLSKGLEGP